MNSGSAPRNRLRKIQPAIGYAANFRDADLSLAELARAAGLSPSRFHRLFSQTAGESPRTFAERLRLERAAAMLVTTQAPVLEISLNCGFQSHEVFTRAFRRRYGIAPSSYRRLRLPKAQSDHARLVEQIGPCIGLYGWTGKAALSMNYTVTTINLVPQPVLLARRTVRRSAIPQTIAETLPQIFLFAQKQGLALSGHPLTRYPEITPGMVTIEPAMRVAAGSASVGGADESGVVLDTLPGGPAAMTLHTGPYDTLPDAYAALEEWMKAQGKTPSGAPWESYVTDPGTTPNPADWKTEVYWPLSGQATA